MAELNLPLPGSFTEASREAVAGRFEAAQAHAEALLNELKAAREILSAEAEPEAFEKNLVIPFFQLQTEQVNGLLNNFEALEDFWAPEGSED